MKQLKTEFLRRMQQRHCYSLETDKHLKERLVLFDFFYHFVCGLIDDSIFLRRYGSDTHALRWRFLRTHVASVNFEFNVLETNIVKIPGFNSNCKDHAFNILYVPRVQCNAKTCLVDH